MSLPMSAPTDITMMHSVTDVQGLNRISRAVLGNGARAMAAMARHWLDRARRVRPRRAGAEKPLVGLTMFGVTTPCVQQVVEAASTGEWEPLVFHATGIGGRSMEKLVDSGLLRRCHRRVDHRDLRHDDGRHPPGDGGPLRRDHPHAPSLCRLGRRARHGEFRRARHGPGALPQPHALSRTIRRSR